MAQGCNESTSLTKRGELNDANNALKTKHGKALEARGTRANCEEATQGKCKRRREQSQSSVICASNDKVEVMLSKPQSEAQQGGSESTNSEERTRQTTVIWQPE